MHVLSLHTKLVSGQGLWKIWILYIFFPLDTCHSINSCFRAWSGIFLMVYSRDQMNENYRTNGNPEGNCRGLSKHLKCHLLQTELNNWFLHILQQSIKVSLIAFQLVLSNWFTFCSPMNEPRGDIADAWGSFFLMVYCRDQMKFQFPAWLTSHGSSGLLKSSRKPSSAQVYRGRNQQTHGHRVGGEPSIYQGI